MQKYGHQHVDLLKIDIEGGEWPVLQDITRLPLVGDQRSMRR